MTPLPNELKTLLLAWRRARRELASASSRYMRAVRERSTLTARRREERVIARERYREAVDALDHWISLHCAEPWEND